MNSIDIKPDMRFKDGLVSFCVIGPTDGRPGFWDVRESLPSAGFMRTKPNIKPFSEEQIRKLAADYVSGIAARQMSTVGIRSGSGERPRNRHNNGMRLRKASSRQTAIA